MTKEKVQYIVKRIQYYRKMQAEGKTEAEYWISKRKEHFVIDGEVLAVFEIFGDIIESERTPWVKELLKDVRRGRKDISIQIDSPVARTKYYLTKERFINKVYECCIWKQLVPYEEVLKSDIG